MPPTGRSQQGVTVSLVENELSEKSCVETWGLIEESIYLSDRVVVMTYRPGTVKRIVEVRLPRPRDPASPEFNRLERELTALVMAEEARHQADEIRTPPCATRTTARS